MQNKLFISSAEALAAELYSGARYLTVTGHRILAGPLVELRDFAAIAERLRAGSTERTAVMSLLSPSSL